MSEHLPDVEKLPEVTLTPGQVDRAHALVCHRHWQDIVAARLIVHLQDQLSRSQTDYELLSADYRQLQEDNARLRAAPPPGDVLARLVDALTREPGESLIEWEQRAKAVVQEARHARDEHAIAWRPIETAPKDGSGLLLAKIVGHIDHPTAVWWIVKGSWSLKWNKWWDGIEPCGLAGPTHWMPIPRRLALTTEGTPK